MEEKRAVESTEEDWTIARTNWLTMMMWLLTYKLIWVIYIYDVLQTSVIIDFLCELTDSHIAMP